MLRKIAFNEITIIIITQNAPDCKPHLAIQGDIMIYAWEQACWTILRNYIKSTTIQFNKQMPAPCPNAKWKADKLVRASQVYTRKWNLMPIKNIYYALLQIVITICNPPSLTACRHCVPLSASFIRPLPKTLCGFGGCCTACKAQRVVLCNRGQYIKCHWRGAVHAFRLLLSCGWWLTIGWKYDMIVNDEILWNGGHPNEILYAHQAVQRAPLHCRTCRRDRKSVV